MFLHGSSPEFDKRAIIAVHFGEQVSALPASILANRATAEPVEVDDSVLCSSSSVLRNKVLYSQKRFLYSIWRIDAVLCGISWVVTRVNKRDYRRSLRRKDEVEQGRFMQLPMGLSISYLLLPCLSVLILKRFIPFLHLGIYPVRHSW